LFYLKLSNNIIKRGLRWSLTQITCKFIQNNILFGRSIRF
jgi:hypothetical protein